MPTGQHTDTALYKWRSKFAGLEKSEARRRQLKEGNRRLKGLVADRALDVQVLKDVPGRKCLSDNKGIERRIPSEYPTGAK